MEIKIRLGDTTCVRYSEDVEEDFYTNFIPIDKLNSIFNVVKYNTHIRMEYEIILGFLDLTVNLKDFNQCLR